MASKKDYYELLGVSKGESKDTIKKAYKKLAMKYHPDRSPEDKKGEYEQKFKEINEAYSILSDDKKRQQYDSYGHDAFQQGGGYQGNPFHGEDISDIFQDIFGGGGFFGGGRSRQRVRRGQDLQYEFPVNFEEAAFGCEKEIEIRKNITCESCSGTGAKNSDLEKCSSCNGSGRIVVNQRTPFGILRQEALCDKCQGLGEIPKEKCDECRGKGVINKKVKTKIKIPEGIDDEQVLRIRGQGDAIQNGESGDLLLIIKVRPHKIFKREGEDIFMELPITFSQAALGDKITVPTLKEETKIKIAPGTQSGTTLRLKDKGIQSLNSYRIGDQFINIKVKTPQGLSRKQKKLFKELSELEE